MPDESEICPTKGKSGDRNGDEKLEDIQTRSDLIAVTFADGYLITKEVDRVAADIVDLGDVDDIRAVDFEEVGPDELLFHILQRTIGDIVARGRDEFDIIPHALEKEDIVFFQLDEFVFGLDKEEIRFGGGNGGRKCGGRRGSEGLGGRYLLLQLLNGFLEAFESKRFFQIVIHVVLEGIEGIFGLGGREDDHRGIRKTIEQVETAGPWHFDIEKEQVDALVIEVLEGIRDIQEMPLHLDQVALFTEFAKEIRGNLDIFYYYTRKLHPKTIKNPNSGPLPIRLVVLP